MTQTAAIVDELAAPIPRAGRREWGLCWLMFASTTLCYMDRQAIALVSPFIKGEFRISNEDFGWVLAAFSLTYALFQVPAGYFADRWDVRWTYAGAVAWWSMAGMLAAFAPTLGLLMACRALLGVGESCNWPCALRVTGTVLPPADRGLGNGIFNSGAAVGAVLAPLTVPLLSNYFGWRTAFLVVGGLGFIWVAVWVAVTGRGPSARFAGRARPLRSPADASPAASGLPASVWIALAALTATAILVAVSAVWFGRSAIWWSIALLMFGLLLIALVLPAERFEGSDWTRSLAEVVRMHRFWLLAIVSISVNVCWHFLVNWMADYFQEDRGLGKIAGGMVIAIPFMAADIGNLGGGALSRLLAQRGMPLIRARTMVVAASAILISSSVWVGAIQSNALVVSLLAVAALGTAAYMANYFAFCQEVSIRHTGLVVGILGGLGNLFAAGFLPIAGAIKDRTGGLGPSFVIVGLLPFVGVAALVWGWRASPSSPKPS